MKIHRKIVLINSHSIVGVSIASDMRFLGKSRPSKVWREAKNNSIRLLISLGTCSGIIQTDLFLNFSYFFKS